MNPSEANHIILPPPPKFCLVIEDCDHDYQALERQVRRRELGLEMKQCSAAREALKLLDVSKSAAGLCPHLPMMIILDLSLPGEEDGRVVLKTVRSDAVLKHIPVVVFTSSNDPADSAWCYKNGANAYHLKRPDLSSFESVVDLLAKHSTRA